MDKEEHTRLDIALSQAFSPAAPVDEKQLFAGRKELVRTVIDVICQRGQHAILFGERGVGKTSLANVLSGFLEGLGKPIIAPRVNCDGTDNYTSLWRKIFSEIQISRRQKQIGFGSDTAFEAATLADKLPKKFTPVDVRRTLTTLAEQAILTVIIDELHRLKADGVRQLFADTIKTLSDHSVPASLVLVGVADTIEELIRDDQSIERVLVQVRVPRMSREELDEIILKGLGKVGMGIEEAALKKISLLSQGLPHYTHLIGLHAAREAIDGGQVTISLPHVEAAIGKALVKAQQSIKSAYVKAVSNPRASNLYPLVLLACALARTDNLGYFAAVDVRIPIRHIMQKPYEIAHFVRYLNDFCDSSRGPVLQKTGSSHRYRFRFINPLIQPFVIMQGFKDGRILLPLLDT